MIDEIKFHLCQTFRSNSEDATNNVKLAEEYFKDNWLNDDFYGCIFQIISSNTNLISVRVSAILLLANLVRMKWTNFHEQLQNDILEFLIFILKNEQDMIALNALEKLIKNTVNVSFEKEYYKLINIVENGLKSNELFISLMFSKYISELFTPLYDNNIDLYANFSNLILPNLCEFICNNNSNVKILTLCFKVIKKLSIPSIPSFFQFSPDFLLKSFLNAINLIKNNYDSEYFSLTLASIVELFNEYIYRNYISIFDESVLVEIINSVLFLLNYSPFKKIKCKCIQFIRWSLSNDTMFHFISLNIDDFIQNILLPIYELSEKDIDDTKNDPFNFMLNFHSTSFEKSDYRSVLYEAIRMKANVSNLLREAIQRKLLEFIQNKNLNISSFYAICYLFSAISNKTNSKMYDILGSFLDCDYYIIQVSSLIAIRHLNVSPQIVLKNINLLEHKLLIIKYFASLNLAEFLPRLFGKDKSFVIKECEQRIDIILKSYFLIIQEFYDYDFVELLQIYIQFFDDKLYIFSENLISEAYSFYINCLIIKNPVSGDIILSSISLLIQKLQRKKEICQNICSLLLQQILNDLKHYPFYSLESIIILISNIIAILPIINEEYISIFSILNKYLFNYPESSSIAYHNLIIRLNNLSIRIPGFIIQICYDILNSFDTNSISSTFSLFSVVFLLYKSTTEVKQFIQEFVPIVKKTFASEDTKTIFTSMIISDPLLTFQLVGSNYISFIEEWADSCSYLELFSVIVNSRYAFNDETLSFLVEKAKQLYYETQFDAYDGNCNNSPADQIQPIILSFYDETQIEEQFFNMFP